MQPGGGDDNNRQTQQNPFLPGLSGGFQGCFDGLGSRGVAAAASTRNLSIDLDTRFFNGGVHAALAQVTTRNLGRTEIDELQMSLENEMAALSIQERKKVFQDLHGYPTKIHETPELVTEALDRLQVQLSKIQNKPAFDIAISQSPEYVQDRKLRLMFLRSTEFDVDRAAERMVKHFEQKRLLFGDEKVGKEITLQDLDKDDIECLRSGSLVFLPQKDRAGRAVAMLLLSRLKYKNSKSICRTQWYTDMKFFSNDEEAQKNGYVVILYMFANKFILGQVDPATWQMGTRTSESLPMRMVALHYCSEGPRLHLVFRAVLEVISTRRRVRFQTHLGSPLECLYRLESFGIPRSLLPVDEIGRLDAAVVEMIVNREEEELVGLDANHRRAASASLKTSVDDQACVLPSANDVLMGGRGNHKFENDGNRRLREWVVALQEKYNAASKFDKTILARMIVKSIKEKGGRFLKKKDDTWTEVDDDVAREKVAHSFRNNRRNAAKRKEEQTT